jgi:parvulin-like peptidyl-prolyl isomerase
MRYVNSHLLATAFLAGIMFASAVAAAEESAPAASPEGAEKQSAPLPAVVAKVGAEPITGKEFKAGLEYRVRRMEQRSGRPVRVDSRFRQDTINEIIEGRLLRIQAMNSGVQVSEDEVNKEYELGKAELGTKAAHDKYLKDMDLTEDEVRQKIRERLIIEKFVLEKTKDLSVSEEEVAAEYERQKRLGRFMRAVPTSDIANILVYAPEDDPAAIEAAHRKIENVRQRVMAGEDFAAVAREVSEDQYSASRGGEYREVIPSQLLPEAGEKITALAAGEVSEPFKSKRGWHLVKVLAQNEPGTIPFEKVKEAVRESLLEPKRQEVVRKLIDEIKLIVNVEVY